MKYSPDEIEKMAKGGRILADVKTTLAGMVKAGVSAWELEAKAVEMIRVVGAEPSFMKVPNYHWVTCINVNAGIVHGIPTKELVFADGDLVSIDLGVYYQGFHTDSSISVAINPTPETAKFLETGQIALKNALSQAIVGNRIWDISQAIGETVMAAGYNPVKALVGHGVGRALHEEPMIPCLALGDREKSPLLEEGMSLAIEVMYTAGKPDLVEANDGWTITTADGKISGLFEETVVVRGGKPRVLTAI